MQIYPHRMHVQYLHMQILLSQLVLPSAPISRKENDMSYIIVKHTVKDYAVWKKAFNQHGATRKAAGSKGAQVLRNEANPNEVVVPMEWTSTDAAKKFATSDDRRKVMEGAGVISAPEIIFSADSARSAN